jgi:GT2 family glycosyltransferase
MEITPISIVIPTHQNPSFLNLCLQSVIEGQINKNQVIVVVDGFYDLNKEILEKWSEHIEVLNLEENVGLTRATNLGVYNTKYDKILIINDDNVVPQHYDKYLLEIYQSNSVITPNQIEPYPSMFAQFHIKDLGTTPENFNLETFWSYEKSISKNKIDKNGSTLPIFMNKYDYLRLGGWDENYNSGLVADWDFFLKCSMSGLEMIRTYNCHFYHFTSISVKGEQRQQAEKYGHEYAKYKWGSYIYHHPETNTKFLL